MKSPLFSSSSRSSALTLPCVTAPGVSFGMIYAAVALSLVLIWRGTRLLNYAQGGMAMITTYIAIEVIYHTGSYWAGFVVALVAGILLGAVCQLTIIRPTMNKPPLNAVIVTIGLLVLLEGLAGIFFGGQGISFVTQTFDLGMSKKYKIAGDGAKRRIPKLLLDLIAQKRSWISSHARAPEIVPSILARLRTMPASCISRSTFFGV